MKNLNMKSKLLLIAFVTLNLYACEKPEVENIMPEKKANGITTVVTPVVSKNDSTTTIATVVTPPIVSVVSVNDSILYQSDFTKSSIDILNGSNKVNGYNFMTYAIDNGNNTFTMTRNSSGSTNNEIYYETGLQWRKVIPDSVTIVTFNITVDNITHNNDYEVQLWNPATSTSTSHYLSKGVNVFDINMYGYTYTDFRIVTIGKMVYGGNIPYTITISNITVKAKKYK